MDVRPAPGRWSAAPRRDHPTRAAPLDRGAPRRWVEEERHPSRPRNVTAEPGFPESP